jgi:DNA-binding transcriptional LysR family regulator
MSKMNFLDLDGHIILTFLTILESSSVSVAAEKLNVSQSAVSHTLAKLRIVLGDPLFVRSGQGLTPTETAMALKKPMRTVLDGLSGLTDQRSFDPKSEKMQFVIAANDMQRDLIFPQLIRELHSEEISVDFEFIPSGHPTVSMMREAKCQLALTPMPPDGADIFQKSLFSGNMMCFYDAAMREPPCSWEEFCDADHLRVQFSKGHTSLDVLRDIDTSKVRDPQVSVTNFNSIPRFVKGTRLIATELELMRLETLQSLDVASLPFGSKAVTIYMIWHERSSNDPAHIWLRDRVQTIADEIPEKLAALQDKPR